MTKLNWTKTNRINQLQREKQLPREPRELISDEAIEKMIAAKKPQKPKETFSLEELRILRQALISSSPKKGKKTGDTNPTINRLVAKIDLKIRNLSGKPE